MTTPTELPLPTSFFVFAKPPEMALTRQVLMSLSTKRRNEIAARNQRIAADIGDPVDTYDEAVALADRLAGTYPKVSFVIAAVLGSVVSEG